MLHDLLLSRCIPPSLFQRLVAADSWLLYVPGYPLCGESRWLDRPLYSYEAGTYPVSLLGFRGQDDRCVQYELGCRMSGWFCEDQCRELFCRSVCNWFWVPEMCPASYWLCSPEMPPLFVWYRCVVMRFAIQTAVCVSDLRSIHLLLGIYSSLIWIDFPFTYQLDY